MPEEQDKSSRAGDVEADRDLQLLHFPDPLKITAQGWKQACVLLLVSRSTRERQIIGLHLLHNLSMQAVAESLDLPVGRVQELWQSVSTRVGVATSRFNHDAFLSSQFAKPSPFTKPGKCRKNTRKSHA